MQKAVVVQQDGSVALREIAVPKPGPDEILVKVIAAAQNPADCGWKLVYANHDTAHLTFFGSCQGRLHCTAGASEQSLGLTFLELSRRLGQMSRMVCAR
jgi:hypothetical protein